MKTNKFKVSIIIVITLIVSFGVVFIVWFSKPKLGFIYNNKVVSSYDGVKDSKKLYQKKESLYKVNSDTLEADLIRMIKKYQQDYNGLTEKERVLTEQIISKKQADLAKYKEVVEKDIREEDIRLTSDVMKQINEFVAKYGKENGYDYIFGTTDNGSLFYAKEGNDLTNKIIEGLNKDYKGIK